MKISEHDDLLILILVITFSLYALSLPSFNGERLYNPFFSNYSLKWFDGKSPLVFHMVKRLFHNHTLVFSKGSQVFKHYPIDFKKVEDGFVPSVGLLNIIFHLPWALPGLVFSKQLLIYKGMLVGNIFLASLTLIFFYLFQKELGIEKKYALLSSVGLGFLTGLIIYTKYFFYYVPASCFFSMSLYFFIRYRESDKIKDLFLLIVSLGMMVFSFSKLITILYIFPFFVYLIKRENKRVKVLVAFLILFFGAFFINRSIYHLGQDNKSRLESPDATRFPFFDKYKEFVPANTFELYGYKILSNKTWTWNRKWNFLYSFEDPLGNALFFMSSSGAFKALFSEKGFIYNSPFLVFSILGIFFWDKEDQIRNFLVLLTIAGLTPSLALTWFGGVTPRYVRHFPIPIMTLTCFTFSYLEVEKKKWILALFTLLVVISFLNVNSLAVRKDWTYERYDELPSHDWILWPYFSSTKTKRTQWRDWTTNPLCKISSGGVLDVCECKYPAYIKRELKVPRNYPILIFKGCSKKAGEDGVYLDIYLNGKREKRLFFSENTCKKSVLNLSGFKGQRVEVKVKIEKYEECNAEMVEVMGVYWSSSYNKSKAS